MWGNPERECNKGDCSVFVGCTGCWAYSTAASLRCLPVRAQLLLLLVRVIIEQIMREPFNGLIRSNLDQLAHALQEERHDGLIKVCTHRQGLQGGFGVRASAGGFGLAALRRRHNHNEHREEGSERAGRDTGAGPAASRPTRS